MNHPAVFLFESFLNAVSTFQGVPFFSMWNTLERYQKLIFLTIDVLTKQCQYIPKSDSVNLYISLLLGIFAAEDILSVAIKQLFMPTKFDGSGIPSYILSSPILVYRMAYQLVICEDDRNVL